MNARAIPMLLLALALASGCNRRVEDFVPGEEPKEPDLSRIFPEGAGRAPEPGQPQPAGGRGAPPVAATAAAIEGVVEVAPALQGRAAGGVLFLIARRGEAGPPTAVKRIASPTFPLAFRLGPEDRMIATMPFEGPLTLTARLDADGDAMTRAPGDLQGVLERPVGPGDRGVTLTLDEQL